MLIDTDLGFIFANYLNKGHISVRGSFSQTSLSNENFEFLKVCSWDLKSTDSVLQTRMLKGVFLSFDIKISSSMIDFSVCLFKSII